MLQYTHINKNKSNKWCNNEKNSDKLNNSPTDGHSCWLWKW